tara:strand:- start:6898 stop:10761 length:3864 start_codon:yes stop_codon:yes gene_type:complete
MPRKKGCSSTSKGTQQAQQHVNQTHQQIDIEIDSLLENEFGRVFGDDITLNQTIQEKTNNIREHQSTIKKLRKEKPSGWGRKLVAAKEKLKRARIDLGNAKKEKSLLQNKKNISNKITELLRTRLHESALKSGYVFNPSKVVKALKMYLMERTGVPFRSLNDLDYQTLNLKYRQLVKWFDNQDKGRVPKGFYGNFLGDVRGAYDYTLKNPADVVLANDKSLMGVALHREISDTLPKKSAKKVQYKEKYKAAMREFTDFIYENNITYFPDPNNQPENPDNLTESEARQSRDNILELQADLMDGRTKYIVPKNASEIINNLDADTGKVIQGSIMDKYNKIITYANNSGFNVSKDIHEIEVGEDVYYYVTMKETQDDGTEIYRAYLAPHYIDDNGRTKFHFPRTKKGLRNGAWVAAINAAQKANQDITDVMTPGFRQAQVEKIFNGYNKKGEEINVKGYAQYNALDVDINSPLFKTSMIKPGFKGTKPVSIWTNVQDTRQILADIFDDWQNLNKATLDRLQKALNKIPELKEAILAKDGDEENAENYITSLVNIIDFGKMIYLDKDGNVQSPNITTGIKENYHPNMFKMTDRVADLLKALSGMKNEIELLDDRIAQLEFKITQESDPEEITSLKAAIIRAKNKKIEYLGDNDNQGAIQVMTTELEVLTGLKPMEEQPRISAQAMISYGKHRKLYTNSLKDPSNEVEYGGRRKDIDVIPDYIDNVFDTIFENDLRVSTIEAAFTVERDMMDYLIEEVKATLGRTDLKAGLPFVNYSNEKVIKMLNKIMPNMNAERLQQIASNMLTMMSGALLGVSTGIGNRMQSIMGNIVELGGETEGKVGDIWNNDKERVEEIAAATGALDTVQAVADMFMGSLESQADIADGMHTKADLALLAGQNVLKFVKGAKGFRRQIINLIKKREGNDVEYTNEQIDALLAGVWEAAHGVMEGNMSEAMADSLYTKLKRIATRKQIKIYAGWGMHFFGLGSSITELKGLEEYVSMIPGEKEMRKMQALRAVVHYADHIVGGKMTGNYLHPEAIAFARILINNTMFQFSLQNFGKAYRGAVGGTTMKFKNYWNMQSRRELQLMLNWAKSMKGLSRGEIRDSFIKLLIPTKNVPFLGRVIGYDSKDVGSFNINERGPFPYMELPTGKGTNRPTEMLRQFLYSRVLTSFLTTVVFNHFVTYRNMTRFIGTKLGIANIQTLGRGGESTLASAAFRLLQVGLGTMYLLDDDEEDENATQLYRLLMPIWLNMALDTVKSGKPHNLLRVYGQWGYEALDFLGNTSGLWEDKD